ncbi:MAG: 4Fe-4S dicluster domain-containing protein [Candidatus Thorarchaeota archaeon]|nr:4Fe-4S dicluster domain-containing protein [Candidatus Thorarchaeota archaeon]
MNETVQERQIPPKRQRMLDMIMVLGGLKEEAAVPLSRVNEEINTLKTELASLTDEILEFPERYLEEFRIAAEKVKLQEQIEDTSVLTEALSNLEDAITKSNSETLIGLRELLKSAMVEAEREEAAGQPAEIPDTETVITPLPQIIKNIDEVITTFEREKTEQAEAAAEELTTLADAFNSLAEQAQKDPEAALEALQKIGTKTRYGPFVRAAGQLKRALRDKRVSPERFKVLVTTNMLVELRRGIILFALRNMGSKTTIQLAELLKTTPDKIQQALITMFDRNEIEVVGIEEDSPVIARVHSAIPETTLTVKRVIQQLRGVLKSVEGKSAEILSNAIRNLSDILERLQLLGEYDTVKIADDTKSLREIADKSTEAILSTQISGNTEELRLLISAGLEAFARFRLKITLEKGPNLVSGMNVYGEQLDPKVYRQIMDSYLENELERGAILLLIRDHGAMTTEDLAKKTGISPDRVLQHVLRMKRDELLTIAGEKHGYVLYDVPRTPNEAEVAILTITGLANDLVEAQAELQDLIKGLQPKDIGRLVNTLEVFSKARDKMAKITVGDAIVGVEVLTKVEDKIKTALSKAYKTRARIPSTRPKVTIEDLMEVDVPSVMEEYRDMMGYAPLLGFGTVKWDGSKCLGCKSCELACPEDAIFLKPVIDVPSFFEFGDESLAKLPVNKALFYRTIKSLATRKPKVQITLEKEAPGFGSIEVDLWLCVACRTCVRRCPAPDEGALELDLKWSLPEVVKHITAEMQ